MSKKRILYALVGVGAGNFSRTLAILERLPQDDYDIGFVAQGNAYELLKERPDVFPLNEISYAKSEENFGGLSIIKQNLNFPGRFRENVRLAAKYIDRFKPDVLIADSDFYCFHPARKRKLPILTVNSSHATVQMFQRCRRSLMERAFSYYVIERSDMWLQNHYADRVICPVIENVDGLPPKVRQTSPIVRKQFLDPQNDNEIEPEFDAAIMFGGSGIGAADIDLRTFKGKILAVGQTANLKLPPQAKLAAFTPRPEELLRKARVLVVQGGFNSVSEVIALRKPGVFVPIDGHAEQFVNARWAELLGLGAMAEPGNAAKALEKVLNKADEYIENCRRRAIACDGARKAARMIEEFVNEPKR